MPSGRKSARRRTPIKRGRATPRKTNTGTGRRAKGLRCPDCDFVAAHPMGLGRHRSARHGVLSGRQRRRESSGAWLTRREAARRAGVHYNTVRHWEQTGKLRRSKQRDSRGAKVSALDLDALMRGGRRSSTGGGDDARIEALERRFNDLLNGLERLVGSARGTRGRPGRRKQR
jgi:hypothetical protein